VNSKHVNLDSKTDKQAKSAAVKNNEALLPHERDQTTDDNSKPRKIMKQALDDLQEGQVDTDMHGQRGVETVVQPTAKNSRKR